MQQFDFRKYRPFQFAPKMENREWWEGEEVGRWVGEEIFENRES